MHTLTRCLFDMTVQEQDMMRYLQKDRAFRSLGPPGFGTTVLAYRVNNLQQIHEGVERVCREVAQGLNCRQAVVIWTGHHDPVEQMLIGEVTSSNKTVSLEWRSLGLELRLLFQGLRTVVQDPNHVSMVFDSCQVAPKLCKQFAEAAGLEQGLLRSIFAFGQPVPWDSFKKVFVDAAKLYCNQEVAANLGCTEISGRLSLQEAFCGALSPFDQGDLRMYVLHMKGTEVRYDFLHHFLPSGKQLLHRFKADALGLSKLGIGSPGLLSPGSTESKAQSSTPTAAASATIHDTSEPSHLTAAAAATIHDSSEHYHLTAAAATARHDNSEPSSSVSRAYLQTGVSNEQCSLDTDAKQQQQQQQQRGSNRNSHKRSRRLSRTERREKARKKQRSAPTVNADATQANQ